MPLHIWGACGVGKSQIVAQVANDLNWHFLDIRAVGTTSVRHVDLLMMESRHRLVEWPASRSGGILPRVLAEAPCPILVMPSQPEMCSNSAFERPADPSQSTES